MDCIFCKIIAGEIPSYTVYEDEEVKVFLDINPSTNGDLLLIPKKHCTTILEIDPATWKHMLEVIQMLYPKLKEKLHCEGLTIAQNNDYGQDIKHFHIHLTPRYPDDLLAHQFNKDLLKSLEEVHQILTEA